MLCLNASVNGNFVVTPTSRRLEPLLLLRRVLESDFRQNSNCFAVPVYKLHIIRYKRYMTHKCKAIKLRNACFYCLSVST